MHGGSDCAGTSVGYRDCVMDPCPVDGGWGSWGHWSTCSVTCGVGTQLRHRSCTHPAPQHGGISCVGSPTSQKQCTHNDCPFTCPTHWVLNGSSCYYVSTTIHAWSYGKHYCKAHNSFLVEIDNSTEDSFILHELSIHHIGKKAVLFAVTQLDISLRAKRIHYTHWAPGQPNGNNTYRPTDDCINAATSHWFDETCTNAHHFVCEQNNNDISIHYFNSNNDISIHYFNSNNDSAIYYFNSNNAISIRYFNNITGAWGEWGSWMACSISCGTGYSARYRICDSSAPLFDGNDCFGSARSYKQCNIGPCPIDGGWSEWTPFGVCSRTCGNNAVKERYRQCNNPVAAFGGADCSGEHFQIDICPVRDCLDGHWQAWNFWSACGTTCGSSVRFRMRDCTLSINNGTCQGIAYDPEFCTAECPVNGAWSEWSVWGTCSQTCDTGVKQRGRTCANPSPAHGGQACVGNSTDAAPLEEVVVVVM
ncbi:semaphorin-5A-like [Mya arenaria]|uniref:semaphorin-5A-like n=1 Tax=Mya arenaria TaxID=6604 RepID=UPI0022E34BF0|nr:semaphorin-5A-like [Mya arenaria]